jgi:hypothetical protein
VVFLLAGCGLGKIEVKSGEKITCRLCGRTISENIKTLKVPKEEARNYRVVKKSEFCENCRSEVISTVRRYMEAFNNQDTATIYSLFAEKSQRAAEEMAGKSTGEYYRQILREGPGVDESEKEYARRALAANSKYPVYDAQFEVLTVEEVQFISPEREDMAKSPVWVKVSWSLSPYGGHNVYFLLIKENGDWKIRDIPIGFDQ